MEESIRLLSEMERYEIININDGDKYSNLGNNDIVIDEEGNFKLLLLTEGKVGIGFLKQREMFEVPWEYVKKFGAKTIIIDVDGDTIKKSHV